MTAEDEEVSPTMKQLFTQMVEMQRKVVDMQEDHNEKYTQLLSLVTKGGNNEGRAQNMMTVQVPSVSNGPTIDAIEVRIVDFEYDEEECTFEQWYDRYQDVFVYDMKGADDCSKVRVLLRHLSVKCNAQYRDHKAPEDVMDESFDGTVATLKSLFGKKESDFELRVRFFNQKMSTSGDLDVMKFAAEVNRLYQKGNLKTITEDQMKITVFLAGLDLPNQKSVRTQLFNAVSLKASITFKELLEKYSTLRALARDVAVAQNVSVNMVKTYNKGTTERSKNPEYKRDKSITCRGCDKKGHYESECWPTYPEKRPKRHGRRSYLIHCGGERRDRVYVNLKIGGKSIEFQVDTGSDVTIISDSGWRGLNCPSLTKFVDRISDANDQSLEILGMFSCAMEYSGVKSSGVVYVTRTPIRLVGGEWFWKLNLRRSFFRNDNAVVACTKSPDDYANLMECQQYCETGLARLNPRGSTGGYVDPGTSQQVYKKEIDQRLIMGVNSKGEHLEQAGVLSLVEEKNESVEEHADPREDTACLPVIPEVDSDSGKRRSSFSKIDFCDVDSRVEVEETKEPWMNQTRHGLTIVVNDRLPYREEPTLKTFHADDHDAEAHLLTFHEKVALNGKRKGAHTENLEWIPNDRAEDRDVNSLGFVVSETYRNPRLEERTGPARSSELVFDCTKEFSSRIASDVSYMKIKDQLTLSEKEEEGRMCGVGRDNREFVQGTTVHQETSTIRYPSMEESSGPAKNSEQVFVCNEEIFRGRIRHQLTLSEREEGSWRGVGSGNREFAMGTVVHREIMRHDGLSVERWSMTMEKCIYGSSEKKDIVEDNYIVLRASTTTTSATTSSAIAESRRATSIVEERFEPTDDVENDTKTVTLNESHPN